MNITDIVAAAWLNLWSRKGRTALNLFGVVLGCVVLLMTFAGTRGVARGIQLIISSSEDVRKVVIYPSYDPQSEVPDAALDVAGEMTDERRQRIRKQLRQQWLREHSDRIQLGPKELATLRSIPGILEVVPQSYLRCRIEGEDVPLRGMSYGVSPRNRRIQDRVIFGEPLQADDLNGVLINEFAAYRLGFRSDQQLKALVGNKLLIEYQVSGQDVSYLLRALGDGDSPIDLSQQAELLRTVQELMQQLDQTSLTAEQKQLLRSVLEAPAPQGNEPVVVRKELIVRGVFRPETDQDLFSFLRVFSANDDADLYLDHQLSTELDLARESAEGFWSAVITIENVEQLRPLIDQLKELGFQSNSAVWIVENVTREIDRVKLGISLIALLVLFISAVGISNTMIIAVLERTPEFGIMKSLGARDRDVLWMMIAEGALTGVVGALVSLVISFSIAALIALAVRQYVTERLGQQYEANVFAFSPVDMLLVLAVACLVCTLASLLPAIRAARLDPIVAMRRR